MKINVFPLMFALAVFMGFWACSPAMVMKKRLPSEWNITRYEEKAVDGSSNSVIDIGSIKFETNGTGTKSINFRIVDRNIEDYQPFEWRVLEDTIIISGTSYFSRAWTVVENSASSQLWRSSDKIGNTQTIVLSKNKPDARISQRLRNSQ
jgi:hypothetical protein